MRPSRKIWGTLLIILGAIWAFAGLFGILFDHSRNSNTSALIAYLILGLLLVRVGFNYRNPPTKS